MTVKRVFNANLETMPDIMDFIEGLISNLPEKAAFDMRLCCEEVLMNIASYAYPNGDGQLEILWEDETEQRKLKVIFEDSGIPCDPRQKEEPELKIPMREKKIGGLGIMMVRQRMDTVDYLYADGKNRLTVTMVY
ncbi:MAG: ATP-binding protein [Treponema sp.]|jgi:anti-sigma regulatory factor (Ser/Thr protein kinase)|nr:ATP-binding protein [Treponema sp.]